MPRSMLSLFAILIFAVVCVSSKQYKTFYDTPKPCKGRQTYMFKFTGAWAGSRQPLNYPSTPLPIPSLGNPTAVFSPLVVVSHSSAFQLFEVTQLASLDGLEQVAENGSINVINESLTALQGKYKPVYDISFSGGPSDSNGGMQMVNITVTPRQPLVSFVTMLFPSPDWITAARSINMCDPQGFWKSGLTIQNLDVYDVGTDSGVTFTSDDLDTQPRMPVSVLTCGTNFCDGNGAIPSVGRVSLVGIKKVAQKPQRKRSKKRNTWRSRGSKSKSASKSSHSK